MNVFSRTSAQKLIDMTPWKFPRYGLHDFGNAAVYLLNGLKRTNLSSLQLILPEWYEYDIKKKQGNIWNTLQKLVASMRSKHSSKFLVSVDIVYLCDKARDEDSEGNVQFSAANIDLLKRLDPVLPGATLSIAYYKPAGAWKVDRTRKLSELLQ